MKIQGFARIGAIISLSSALLVVVLLGLLHILSPEFDPSWRMVSEYANGNFGSILFTFFVLWGVSSLALVPALRATLKTRGGKVGMVLLAITGICQILAAIFTVGNPLHDLAGNVAIPAFSVAALLITRSFLKDNVSKASATKLRLLAHASWVSIVLLAVSFIALMVTYMASGVEVSSGAEVTTIPDGVIALVGWANRLLVVIFAAWTAVAAYTLLNNR